MLLHSSAGVFLPSDIPEKYCGQSYLMAVVDVDNEVVERDERNNVGTATHTNFLITCTDSGYTNFQYYCGPKGKKVNFV